jgi:hypothetical protein
MYFLRRFERSEPQNLEFQRTLGHSTVFSVNYVGNRGYDLLLVNPYLNGFCTTAICGSGFTELPTSPVSPQIAAVQQLNNNGYSNYNGVTASLHQNMSHGLSAQFNYTYSHANDNVSNGGLFPYSVFNSILLQIDPQRPNASYASSDYDLRHLLNHVNFQNPETNSLSSSFGMITSAVSPPTTPYGAFASAAEDMRIFQIVGKISF